MIDWIYDEEWIIVVLIVVLLALVFTGFLHIANKQEYEKKAFMAECLKENKQYQCDVLWSQTDASKQLRDAAIGFAAGAAIGAAAVSR